MAKNKRISILGHYNGANVLSLAILTLILLTSGLRALVPVITLAVIEVTFSFENAVLNSRVLATMNKLWRQLFLTVGILIAVFGVRLVLPLLMVAVTTGGSLRGVFDIAVHQPEVYTHLLKEAYPLIAASGVTFLFMVSVHFFTEDKNVFWIKSIEKPLVDLNKPWLITGCAAILALTGLAAVAKENVIQTIVAGLVGVITFSCISLANGILQKGGNTKHASWLSFIYLEILDASFSLDGVIAAFAITKDVLLISAGLGIGALYVRSMTVHLMERGVLTQYRYLIHGAHYAIGVLAVILLLSIRFEIPNVVASLTGLTLVVLALQSSRRYNQRA